MYNVNNIYHICLFLMGQWDDFPFQFYLTLQTAVPESKDIETRGRLFQQMLTLADCILDGYSSQLVSLASNVDMEDRHNKVEEEFTQQRYALLSPFRK